MSNQLPYLGWVLDIFVCVEGIPCPSLSILAEVIVCEAVLVSEKAAVLRTTTSGLIWDMMAERYSHNVPETWLVVYHQETAPPV